MSRNIKRLLAGFLMIAAYLCSPTQALAQDLPDTRAPLIELETVAQAPAGSSQVFTVQVVDDRELKDVLFYQRRAGQQPFIPIAMQPLGDAGFYTVTIETEPGDLRAFEYYIQARDEGGNRTVEGFAFDPYVRELESAGTQVATETTVTAAPTPVPSEPAAKTSSIRWWHIAAGILVTGAVIGAASSGGGGSSGDNTIPLTITLTGP